MDTQSLSTLRPAPPLLRIHPLAPSSFSLWRFAPPVGAGNKEGTKGKRGERGSGHPHFVRSDCAPRRKRSASSRRRAPPDPDGRLEANPSGTSRGGPKLLGKCAALDKPAACRGNCSPYSFLTVAGQPAALPQ